MINLKRFDNFVPEEQLRDTLLQGVQVNTHISRRVVVDTYEQAEDYQLLYDLGKNREIYLNEIKRSVLTVESLPCLQISTVQSLVSKYILDLNTVVDQVYTSFYTTTFITSLREGNNERTILPYGCGYILFRALSGDCFQNSGSLLPEHFTDNLLALDREFTHLESERRIIDIITPSIFIQNKLRRYLAEHSILPEIS